MQIYAALYILYIPGPRGAYTLQCLSHMHTYTYWGQLHFQHVFGVSQYLVEIHANQTPQYCKTKMLTTKAMVWVARGDKGDLTPSVVRLTKECQLVILIVTYC